MGQVRRRRFFILLLLIYMAAVVWFTVLNRPMSYYASKPELFWSYKEWFSGNGRIGREILGNIAMFVPFGFFLAELFPRRYRTLLVLLSAAAFSLCIELLQLVLLRGFFEWDDLVSNTGGALIGLSLMTAVERLKPEKTASTIKTIIACMFAAVCICVFLAGQLSAATKIINLPRAFCCQINEAAFEGEQLTLRGFAFRYEYPMPGLSLILRSTETGEKIRIAVVEKTAMEAVNDYFRCEYDYTDTGFTARGRADPNTEYEVLVKWPWMIALPTGIYIKGQDIHYAAEKDFAAPELSEPFVTKGVLRAYRPDAHCWVYQYEGALYWIADQGFAFEENGKTFIQYQLRTTQIEKLPEKRLKNKKYWDNIGGYFEKLELEGNYGKYRVMKRELPDAYAVTSVTTGYYKNGIWIWKSCFRPIYSL